MVRQSLKESSQYCSANEHQGPITVGRTSFATASTELLMFAEERVEHVKTSVRTPDVTSSWQPAFVCIRQCAVDDVLHQELSKILNVDLDDSQWIRHKHI